MSDVTVEQMREYMKEIRFHTEEEGFQEQADVLNKLIPAIVGSITDEEILTALTKVTGEEKE